MMKNESGSGMGHENVILLNMSILRNRSTVSHYHYKKNQEEEYRFDGISQLEPGTKYILSRLAEQGEHVDRIVIMTTPEAEEAAAFYQERIIAFCNDSGTIQDRQTMPDSVKAADSIEEADSEWKNQVERIVSERLSKESGPIDYEQLLKICQGICREMNEKYEKELDPSEGGILGVGGASRSIGRTIQSIDEAVRRAYAQSEKGIGQNELIRKYGDIASEFYRPESGEGEDLQWDFFYLDKELYYAYYSLKYRYELARRQTQIDREKISVFTEYIERLEKYLDYIKNRKKEKVESYIREYIYRVYCGMEALQARRETKIFPIPPIDSERAKRLFRTVVIREKRDYAFYQVIHEICDGQKGLDIHLYIDMQGGARSFMSEANAIVELLKSQDGASRGEGSPSTALPVITDEPIIPSGGLLCQDSELQENVRTDEPIIPTGGSLCQDSELQENVRTDEPIIPAGGSLCQDPELQENILIDEEGAYSGEDGGQEADVRSRPNVILKGRYAVDFRPVNLSSEIQEVSESYRTYDLIMAMTEFKRYGRGAALIDYFKNKNDADASELMEIIEEASSAIALCNIGVFDEMLMKLGAILWNRRGNYENRSSLDIVWDDILDDYYGILDADRSTYAIECIQWCARKSLLQQALTYIESRMPFEFVRNGFIYYAASSKEADDCKEIIEAESPFKSKEDINYEGIFIKNIVKSDLKIQKGSYEVRTSILEDMLNGRIQFESRKKKDLKSTILNYYSNLEEGALEKFGELLGAFYELVECRNATNHANRNVQKSDSIQEKIRRFCGLYNELMGQSSPDGVVIVNHIELTEKTLKKVSSVYENVEPNKKQKGTYLFQMALRLREDIALKETYRLDKDTFFKNCPVFEEMAAQDLLEICESVNVEERKKQYFETDSGGIMEECAELDSKKLALFLYRYPKVPRYLAPYLCREWLSKRN